MLQSVERPKMRDVIANRLKQYIAEGNLKPGDRLPTETELASSFGVSRLSLREATKSLEYLGILEARPGRGLTVGSVNLDRVTELLGFHPLLNRTSPEELIDTRIIIEVGVLPQLARRMKLDDRIYQSLHEVNNQLRQTRSLQRFVELDIAFHRGLIAGSGLSPLLAFGDVLAVFFQRFRESVKRAEWQQGIASHQSIIDALRAGKVSDAEKTLRTHIESHRNRLETAR
jgi:DNA-binding FadR family transcriptional regulator